MHFENELGRARRKMSRGWGARTERQSRVLLNVYDLHDTNEYLEVSICSTCVPT